MRLLYDTTIVSIVEYSTELVVYIEIYGGKKLKNSFERRFVLNDSYSDKLLFNYLAPYLEDTPYHYVALLDNTTQQGVIPTCNKQEMKRFKDLSTSKYICYKNEWAFYTSQLDLEIQTKRFSKIGVDFIFSPFILLQRFFQDKIDASTSMFVLVLEHSITILVFKESKMLFGSYIDYTPDEITDEEFSSAGLEDTIDETEENIDLDEIDLDALDDALDLDDSLDDLDDLDALDDLDGENLEQQLDENLEIIDNPEVDETEETKNGIEKEQHFTKDFQRFTIIQNTLETFYKDDRFESEFIEHLYIADNGKLGSDFKKYIQDEMFLTPFIRTIEPEIELAHLAKEEAGIR